MMTAPLPRNEAERLDALDRYNILDTLPEQDFDNLALMAVRICGTPMTPRASLNACWRSRAT